MLCIPKNSAQVALNINANAVYHLSELPALTKFRTFQAQDRIGIRKPPSPARDSENPNTAAIDPLRAERRSDTINYLSIRCAAQASISPAALRIDRHGGKQSRLAFDTMCQGHFADIVRKARCLGCHSLKLERSLATLLSPPVRVGKPFPPGFRLALMHSPDRHRRRHVGKLPPPRIRENESACHLHASKDFERGVWQLHPMLHIRFHAIGGGFLACTTPQICPRLFDAQIKPVAVQVHACM